MAVLNQLRLPDGRMVRVEEWGELPLWSSAVVGATAGAVDILFWNYGIGDALQLPAGTVRQATENDTNMSKGAQLLGGEMFIFAHTLEPAPTMVEFAGGPPPIPTVFEQLRTQIKETMSVVYLLFTVASKVFNEGFIQWIPAGGGLYGNDIQNGASIFTNGVPSPASIRRYNIPIHIASSSEVFLGRFQFKNGGLQGALQVPPRPYHDWKWIWKLEGLRRRQVV